MSAAATSTVPEGPRNFITTPEDHGGILLAVSAVLMTYTALFFLIRIYMRAGINGPFALDDITVGVGTVSI